MVTIATGSLLASALLVETISITEAIVGAAVLFSLQIFISYLRILSPKVGKVVNNQPILLLKEGVIIESNLKKARVSQADLYAQLRLQGVTKLDQVTAVILESAADFSIITKPSHQREEVSFDQIDPALLKNVRK